MELEFAFLADGATHRPDGKLDVFGAGFDTIFATSVPAQHPSMVLAIRVLITADEAREMHRVDVVLRRVNGEDLGGAFAEMGPSPEAADTIPAGRLAGIGMLLSFNGVVFPDFGQYEFVIQWDQEDVRHPIRLFVAEVPAAPSS